MILLSPAELNALLLSLKVSFWCVIITLPLGIFCGWLLARKKFWGKTFVDSVIHLPLVLPPVVTGYLLLTALGRQGIIGGFLYTHFGWQISFSWQGAVIASAVVGFPLMVRSIRLSVGAVDVRLEEAAASLGASPLRVFYSITLPLSLPGILTGSLLAFARSLGEFGATITFVGNIAGMTRTLPLAIYTFIQSPGGEQPASRLVVISIILAFATLFASEAIANKKHKQVQG